MRAGHQAAQVGAPARAGLGQQPFDVLVDGPARDGQLVGDLPAGAAGRDEPQHVVLALRYGKLSQTTIGIEEAELDLPVLHDGSAISPPLDPHAGQRRQLVGDLVDERGDGSHHPILYRLARPAIVNAVPLIAWRFRDQFV